jgi:hypothetical protein
MYVASGNDKDKRFSYTLESKGNYSCNTQFFFLKLKSFVGEK